MRTTSFNCGLYNCVAMVTIALFMLSAVISSVASSSLCNITNDISPPGSGQFYSLEHNNSCYVFALQEVTIRQAMKNCRALGGHLTDVDKQNDNILQNYIKAEKGSAPYINKDYWIGLLYNDDMNYWYWINDAEIREDEFGSIKPWRFTVCVTLSHDKLINRGCGDEKQSYICKLDLGCISPTDSTSCQRCRAVVQNKANLTSETSTPDDGPNSSENDSNNSGKNSSNITNSTENVVPTVPDNQKHNSGDDCKQLPRGVDPQTVVLVAVLGGVDAILIVALGATCVIIFKYRRLMRRMQPSPRISLVDILNADTLATNTKRPSQQTDSHHGSATELLYSQADGDPGPIPDPSKVDRQAVTTSDIIYHNHGSFHGTGGRTHESSPDAKNNVYSHLNHSGESLDNSGPRQVYGMESASDFKEPSKEKSKETYEQYNY